jgi:hypothetical protein
MQAQGMCRDLEGGSNVQPSDTRADAGEEFLRQAPAIEVPEARLYGHPTRLVESWAPAPERIVLPAYEVPGAACRVRVQAGSTRWQDTLQKQAMSTADLKKWIRAQVARTRPPVQHDGLFMDLRTIVEGNIAHVLLYIAPMLAWARRILREERGWDEPITAVLRWRAAPLAVQALERLDIRCICTDAEVSGAEVTIDLERKIFPAEALDMECCDMTVGTPEKVFIARRGSRNLLNEEEIAELLSSRGFVRYCFEEIDLPLQWSIMRNAHEVVAVHGAALGALVFNRGPMPESERSERLKVLELFSAGYIVNCYRELTALLDGDWAGVRGPISAAIVRDVEERGAARSHANTPFRADPALIEEALDWLHRPRPARTEPAELLASR